MLRIQIRFLPDPDPGDSKRTDPDPQHWFICQEGINTYKLRTRPPKIEEQPTLYYFIDTHKSWDFFAFHFFAMYKQINNK